MPHSDIRDSKVEPANGGRKPSDKRLLDLVQRQTFRHSGELLTPSAGWRATRQGLADPMDDSPSAVLVLASWLYLSPASAAPRLSW